MGNIEKNWRYERKFVVEDLTFGQVEDFILGNSYLFKEIYNVRQVNNIYFDDIQNTAYYSNIEGLSERKKYRIRWYGELLGEIKNSVLEAKVKNATLGTKFHFNINAFIMKRRFDPNIFNNIFKESDLADDICSELLTLAPALVNSYQRKYYMSHNGLYRVTIDRDISYYYVSPNISHVLTKSDHEGIVIEIKYAYENDNCLDKLTNQFPFRLGRNSKYVQGVSTINDLLY
ncbi:VTC domain-containing protein [Amylibacter sp.]|nr:VTC domain-containing protein [Amylibacter sp.]